MALDLRRGGRADRARLGLRPLLLLAKVESIGVQQGLIARLLNYGDLTVTGTGGAREIFRRVRDPIGFRNHVQQASLGAGSTGA